MKQFRQFRRLFLGGLPFNDLSRGPLGRRRQLEDLHLSRALSELRGIEAQVGQGFFRQRLFLGLHNPGKRSIPRFVQTFLRGNERRQARFDDQRSALDGPVDDHRFSVLGGLDLDDQ